MRSSQQDYCSPKQQSGGTKKVENTDVVNKTVESEKKQTTTIHKIMPYGLARQRARARQAQYYCKGRMTHLTSDILCDKISNYDNGAENIWFSD